MKDKDNAEKISGEQYKEEGGMAEKVRKEQDKTEMLSWEGKEGQDEDG
jgi:hypothetical protein